jgi:arginine exporter protein ArgO
VSAAFWAGVVAGYGVAVPVGAIAVLIAGLTARTSLRVGAAAGLGAATADGVYALIAVLGGAALAAAITPIATPLRWVAAVVLVLLAAYTARSALRRRSPVTDDVAEPVSPASPAAPTHDEAADARRVDPAVLEAPARGSAVRRAGRGAARGAAAGRDTAWADTPTPGRAYLGVLGLTLLNPATIVYFGALVLGRGGTGGGVWFVTGAFLASASWQLLIAGGGALVGRLLTGERGRRITALVSSVVIAILAVGLIA